MQNPKWENKIQCQKPGYGVGFCKSARKIRAEWWVGTEKGTDLEARTAGLCVYLRESAGHRHAHKHACAPTHAHMCTQVYT